jgi:tight adherence protein B
LIDSSISKRRANRRLSLLSAGMENREVYNLLRLQPASSRAYLGPLARPVLAFETLVSQSGLPLSPRRALAIMVTLCLLTFVGLQVGFSLDRLPAVLRPLSVQAGISLSGGIGLLLFYLSSKRKARVKKFSEQLPDALDVMVRSLKAGHPINAAMALVSKEMSDPMGTEFGLAVDEMTYGLDMREAMKNLSDRISVEDFNYVMVSINIQHETGGNLAEVLSNLSRIIHDRARMFMKIRALSGEGRMSAMILCILPFAVGGFIFMMNPDFYTGVADDPLFLPILSGALLNMLLGIISIQRMVNFRV